MSTYCVFGYVSVVVSSRQAANSANFKAFEKVAAASFPGFGCIPREQIIIEELFRSRLARPEFDNLIQLILDTSDRHDPKGCVVISSFSDLGSNDAARNARFMALVENDIGLYIIDAPDYSTVSWDNLLQYSKAPEERKVFSFESSDSVLGKRVGRIAKQIDPKFKALYWGYETFRLSEKDVLSNLLYPVSKVTFHKLCDRYEQSPEYAADEERAVMLYPGLAELPKRHGAISSEFKNALILHGDTSDPYHIRLCCDKAGRSPLTAITYHRYYIKYDTDKKALSSLFRTEHDNYWLERHATDWETK